MQDFDFMQVVASAFDLLIINRYNIAWGIPDKWFYMFGDAVIGYNPLPPPCLPPLWFGAGVHVW